MYHLETNGLGLKLCHQILGYIAYFQSKSYQRIFLLVDKLINYVCIYIYIYTQQLTKLCASTWQFFYIFLLEFLRGVAGFKTWVPIATGRLPPLTLFQS